VNKLKLLDYLAALDQYKESGDAFLKGPRDLMWFAQIGYQI
jgi:hypothetical protein